MKTKSADYQELELISDTAPKQKSNKQHLLFWLFLICKSLAKVLLAIDEPQIWQKADGQGDIYWKVYDPVTGRTAYFGSEAEVHIWLEQRYYWQGSEGVLCWGCRHDPRLPTRVW